MTRSHPLFRAIALCAIAVVAALAVAACGSSGSNGSSGNSGKNAGSANVAASSLGTTLFGTLPPNGNAAQQQGKHRDDRGQDGQLRLQRRLGTSDVAADPLEDLADAHPEGLRAGAPTVRPMTGAIQHQSQSHHGALPGTHATNVSTSWAAHTGPAMRAAARPAALRSGARSRSAVPAGATRPGMAECCGAPGAAGAAISSGARSRSAVAAGSTDAAGPEY